VAAVVVVVLLLMVSPVIPVVCDFPVVVGAIVPFLVLARYKNPKYNEIM
jgi:hypothetical protein